MNLNILLQIAANSRKAFFIYHPETKCFSYVSKAAEKIWETDTAALIASPQIILGSIHPDDKSVFYTTFEKLTSSEPVETEIRVILPDNSSKKIKLEAHPLSDEENGMIAVAGIAEDITEHARYVDYLIEYARRKDSALEIIAHDLRGPLGIVKSIAAQIDSDHQVNNYAEFSTLTRFLNQAYDNCSKLINDLLSDEHLRAPTVHVKKEIINTVELMHLVAEPYQKSRNPRPAIDVISVQEKIMAMLDKVKFMQIMNNLISNSIKFTPPNGQITIKVEKAGNQLLITHTDTGIGIPAKYQRFLFDKYSKASRPGLQGEPSRGVGLFIVRDLVEIQGGIIRFDSQENEGTTFYITFPLQD